MTRETKIGLMVGLAFIVLFGFLLSGVGRDSKAPVVPAGEQPVMPPSPQQGPSAGQVQRPRFVVDSVLDRLGRSTPRQNTATQRERSVGSAAVAASAEGELPGLSTGQPSPTARSIDPSRDWCERKEIDLSPLRTAAAAGAATVRTTANAGEKTTTVERAGTAAARPRSTPTSSPLERWSWWTPTPC